MRTRYAALLALALATPALASAQAQPSSVTIVVAANMKPAFEEIASRFRARHPGVEVKVTYGASGNFFAQIANGAPFDLFLSADAEYPAKVVEKGLSDGKASDPSVRRIAIANPDVAPYGRAARSALEKAGLYGRVKDRIVMGQSVAQAAQFVQSGNVSGAGDVRYDA